jgi:hypothetical protein
MLFICICLIKYNFIIKILYKKEMNTFEKFLIQVIIYILGILIVLFLDIYIVYLSLKKNTKMIYANFFLTQSTLYLL